MIRTQLPFVSDTLQTVARLLGMEEGALSVEKWKSFTAEEAGTLLGKLKAEAVSPALSSRAVALLVELAVRAGVPARGAALLAQAGVAGGQVPRDRVFGLPLFNAGWALAKASRWDEARPLLAAAGLADPGFGLLALRLLEGEERDALAQAMLRCTGKPGYAPSAAAAVEALQSAPSLDRLEALAAGLPSDHGDAFLFAALQVFAVVEREQEKLRAGQARDVRLLLLAAEVARRLPGTPWVLRDAFQAFVLTATANLLPVERRSAVAQEARQALARWSLRGALTPEALSAQIKSGASLLDLYVRLALAPEVGIVDWREDRGWRRPLLIALGAFQLLAAGPASAQPYPGAPEDESGQQWDPYNMWPPRPPEPDERVPYVDWAGPAEGRAKVASPGPRTPAPTGAYVVAVAPAAVQKVLEVLEALRQGVSALFCGDSPALREACSRAAEVKASALLREMREASPELNPFSQQSVSLPMPGPSTGADEELRMQVGKLLRLVRGGAATREEREEALCFFAGLEAAHLAGEETLATWTSMYGDLRPLFLFAKAVLQDSLGDFVSAKESLLSAALAINSPDRPGPDAVDWVDQALQDRVGLEYALLTGASLDERPYSRHVRFLMAVNYVVNRDAGAPPRSPEELIQDIERAEALARQGMLP